MKRFDTDHVMKYVTCGPIVAKCRSKISSRPSFTSPEKILMQLHVCPDSPRGPPCSEHARQNFHLPWQK